VNDKQRFLLDTNILSDLVRRPAGVVTNRIIDVGEDNICTSIIVAAELRFGAAKRGSPRLSNQLESILSQLVILPFEEPADQYYAQIRYQLEKIGTPIGPNDLLIAAQSLSMGMIMVTANIEEFSRVPGLAVENWLDESS
jgi:tRNA(fMet)-specific endonuclease VapC